MTNNQCALILCDTQSVTGIGLLVTGYVTLRFDISAYHWYILVWVAWFSNLTHISGLIFLGEYLRKHPHQRAYRVFFRAVLWLLLLVAQVPTGYFNWVPDDAEEPSAANLTSPARCFFDLRTANARFDAVSEDSSLAATDAFQNMVFSVLVVGFTFFNALVDILPSSGRVRRKLKTVFNIRRWKSSSQTRSVLKKISGLSPLVALYDYMKLMSNLLGSMLSQVGSVLSPNVFHNHAAQVKERPVLTSTCIQSYSLVFSAIWGSRMLFQSKSLTTLDEGTMTFGQILPIFLLLAPVLAVCLELLPVLRRLETSSGSTSHTQDRWYVLDLLMQYIPVAQRDWLGLSNVQSSSLPDNTNQLGHHVEATPTTGGTPISNDLYKKPWIIPTAILEVSQIYILTIVYYAFPLGSGYTIDSVLEYAVYSLGHCMFSWGFIWLSSMVYPVLVSRHVPSWLYGVSISSYIILCNAVLITAVLVTGVVYYFISVCVIIFVGVMVVLYAYYKKRVYRHRNELRGL